MLIVVLSSFTDTLGT